jgi:serine/threonine-protein kinase
LYDQDDHAFLADFGIALQIESTWQRNLASGTPAYMSPEQAQREEVIDLRSDVYSLGIIAFEMLTQGLPFEGNLPVSVLLKHIYDPPPSLGAVNPDLPAALDPVLQCALAGSEERYQSAGEFT